MVVNALSVDVEEYFHAAIFRSGTNASAHGDFESRLVTYQCSGRCPQRRSSAFARRTGDRRSLFYIRECGE